jgi:hypothetical protein
MSLIAPPRRSPPSSDHPLPALDPPLRAWLRSGLMLLAALPAWAAGGGGERIVLVADSRRFTGWQAWWTNLYNESHLWFAVTTVVAIPALGLTLGKLTGLVLARTGINLKSRVLAEH